ncbi:MAG: oxidoreductase [Peptococcaceae bacterium]|nr:oxidoreductase [Peptococcaceae bacterium]
MANMGSFKALFIEQDEAREVRASLTFLSPEQLDAGEVLIRVHYSSINYKDALAATGAGKVIRRFPCVGGIDMSGEVVESADPRFKAGDPVIATSYEIGVAHHGGYAEYARIPAKWVIPLPSGLDLLEAMALGTAGLSAALGIVRMEDNGMTPEGGPVVVTGASGGVGGLAIDMLASLGYKTTALTGKAEEEGDFFRHIGVTDILSLKEIDLEKVRPMEASRWAGAVDNVGGQILHWVLATMCQAGVVASIGNAADFKIRTTVFPFILRGVSLLGIDSGYGAMPLRQRVWTRLGADLKPPHLQDFIRVIDFDELPDAFPAFIEGRARRRTVVRILGATK